MTDKKYDFDTVPDRRGTGALKYDALTERYGRTDLTSMWVADMDFEVAPEITEALIHRLTHPVYGYNIVPQSYLDAVKGWISRHYGMNVTEDELIYVNGIVKGIGFAINFYTRPGDKVLIQPPVYHPFRLVTEGNGRKVVNNPLVRTPEGYRMDLEGLEKTVAAERPRMMILCNPHNPGGIQWDADTLREVARIAAKYSMTVISDEIHGDLMLNGKRHISFSTVSPEAEAVSITFGAPSKTFNIAGLVSSWAVIRNPELRKDFYEWMKVNEFCEPTFIATKATETAYRHCEPWLKSVLEYLEGNVEAVDSFLKENLPMIHAIRPDASFLIWLDCRELGLSQEELNDLFVNRAHLALNDGAMFGEEGTGYMRLNIGTSRATITDALTSLKKAIDQLH